MAPILVAPKDLETNEQRAALLRKLLGLIEGAAIDGDNLLVGWKPSLEQQPFVIFALARQAGGTLAVQSIEIDRHAVVLSQIDGDGRLPFDQLRAAARACEADADVLTTGGFQSAMKALATHIAAAMSRLSIVKARLDMQATFLAAVVDADAGPPLVRLDSPMNLQGAREMALMTRSLLSRQSLNIGNNNRRTLQTLFEGHAIAAK